MPDPDHRVALITGGGRGLGSAFAVALADAGIDIAVNFRQDRAAAERTAQAVASCGRRAAVYQAAVEDEEAVAAMVAGVKDDFGRIDVLINNAGVVTAPTNVVDLTVEQVEHEWRVHALGSFLVSRAVIPHMRERGGGSIVMISSIGAAIFAPRHAPYTMAKSALEALARTIAKEEREHGIRVNIVAPGVTDTEMTRALLEHSGVTDIRTLDATSPFGHVCTAEEVAHVVRFVVSPESSYLNDQRITIDGGTF